MAALKTIPTRASVHRFLGHVADRSRRADCYALLRLMRGVTRAPPRMWGRAIVGFGNYHYRYASGREGDWFWTGFSPRKHDLTIYLMAGLSSHAALLRRLGPHKTGKSCLYVKRLSDLDVGVLETLVRHSVALVKRSH